MKKYLFTSDYIGEWDDTFVKKGTVATMTDLDVRVNGYYIFDVGSPLFYTYGHEIKPDKKVYIGGSLFSESEIDRRLKEEEIIKANTKLKVFNPINSPQNEKDKNLPTSEDIFWGDTKEILSSDIVIMDMSNQTDLGCATEIGIIWAMNYIHKLAEEGLSLDEILKQIPKKKFIGHLSDIRKTTSNLYQGNRIPWGYNQFTMGSCLDMGEVKDNFNEVMEVLKNE